MIPDSASHGTPLKKSRLYGPEVRLVEREGARLVEKTYRQRHLPVRVLGRLLIAWETFIYSRLSGIPGIPAIVASPDAYTITTTFMGGHNLRSRRHAIPDARYFEELECLVRAVHDRGVIHLDLRNRRNYGMDDEGSPYLVDFASSVYLPFRGPLWRVLRHVDFMGLAKLKAKLNPTLLGEADRHAFVRGRTLSRFWLPPQVLRLVRKTFERISGPFR